MAQLVKTISGLAIASCKTVNDLAIASVKTVMGLDNTAAGSTVTIDSVGTPASEGTNASSVAPTITVGNNANRALYVMVGIGDAGQNVVATVTSSAGGTFVKVAEINGTTWARCEIWRLLNPATGAHTVTVSAGVNSWETAAAGLISLYNVNQTVPEGTPVQVNMEGSSTAPTTGSITLAAGALAIGVIATDSGPTCTLSAGTIFSGSYPVLNINSDTAVSAASRATTGALSWTTGNEPVGIAAIPVLSA